MPEYYDQPEFRQTPYWASDNFWSHNNSSTAAHTSENSLPDYMGMQSVGVK